MVGTEKNIWVVIPAYNEDKVIRSVIEPLVGGPYNIVVIDDDSTDDTLEAIRGLPVHSCHHIVNLGQGAALQTGIAYALSKDADYIVTYDADGQHVPENIPKLLEPLINDQYDVALGTRFKGDEQPIGIPKTKLVLLKLAVAYSRFATNLTITDTHNGARALTATAAKKINITQNRMAHASQILSQIYQHKMRYVEVPVTVVYTSYSINKGQKISNFFNILWESLLQGFKR